MQHGNPNSSKYEIANSRFRVSEFPGPLRGSAEGRQNLDSMFPSVQTPGYSSANSRFRVSEFPGPLRGSREVRRGIPKSRFHVSSWADSRILLCKFQIPRFRVCRFQDTPGHIPDSEFPSFRGPLLPLRSKAEERDSQIPDSEFPSFRGPLLGRRTQQEGPTNSQIKFPSVIPSAHQRREHRFQNTERSFYFRSCTFV